MREWAQEDGGDVVAGTCANCHSVALADGSARSAAVTCEACHQGRAAGAGPGGWLVDVDQPIRGRRTVADAPHPLTVEDALWNDTLCLLCHGELRNPAGVPLCTTGPEHAAAAEQRPCVACHAPDGDHRFDGTSSAVLARAATLDVAVEAGAVTVTVHNVTGHALPTGSALREVRLEVIFLDAAGQPVWRNADDQEGRFAKVLQDAQGNAPVPAWRASGVARDSRLAVGNSRQLRYPTPTDAARVEARLVYRRAPAGVAARLGLADDPHLQPVTMASTSRPLTTSLPEDPGRTITERTGK